MKQATAVTNFLLSTIIDLLKIMNKRRFLKDLQQGLKHSVDYFSVGKKRDRESWTAQTFLKNVGLQFLEIEIVTPTNDPPDVVFRDSRFEIKEILDPGRRKHLEYKEQLKKSYTTEDPADLLSAYTFIHDLTPQDILKLIGKDLEKFETKYEPAMRAGLDLLFYINLIHHTIQNGKMPDQQSLAKFGWRSVSALFGWASLVFYANGDAPGFLQEKRGQLIMKKF
jgi:hypothetical protein